MIACQTLAIVEPASTVITPSAVLAILVIPDSCAKLRSTSVNRIHVNIMGTAKISSEATVAAVCPELLEQIAKSTSMNVTAILVRMELRASTELTSTHVNAYLDLLAFIAKQTSTNVLLPLAPTTESASILSMDSNANACEDTTMQGV